MLRQRLNDDLKTAMKARDPATTSTLRMVLAALKDRDIAARPQGITDGIDEAGIIDLLQKMVKQRQESIELYKQGGRQELVEKEQGEIDVIERYMPKKLSEAEALAAIDEVVGELGASSIKDMGKVMAALKERFAGRMDFAKAGGQVKQKLG
ncbi:MAG TPA: GatB/YqeY domain-containing protein [Dongiaceae bacterium]|nr:GatB/YqeY domain-containing protein [Dongiaceae bacterium]